MLVIWGTSQRPDLNRAIAAFVAATTPGCERGFAEPYKTMGVVKDGQLVGGVVFNNWHPEARLIELHGAATDKKWLSRDVLASMFGYPFDHLGCQLAVMRVSERNRTMIRIGEAYGFKSHYIARLRGPDEGEHVMTLTVEDWRASRFHMKGKTYEQAESA